MAARFIAFASRDPLRKRNDHFRTLAFEALSLLYSSSRLLVFANADCAAAVHTEYGLVIGDIFAKPHVDIPAEEEAEWLEDIYVQKGFSGLLRSCWGAYVAFRDDPGRPIEILCSPLGSLPCYKIQTAWGAILASDPDILVSGGLLVPEVDFEMIDAQLRFRTLRSPRTALGQLEELPGGYALQLGAEDRSTALWSPWTFTSNPVPLKEHPVTVLEQVVRYCVKAWSRRFDRLLLSLSGGLDSAIVAACLKEVQSDVHAVTMTDGTAASDERPFAEAVMRKCLPGTLTNLRYDLASIDIAISSAQMLPRPCGSVLTQGVNAARRHLATELACPAIFTGFGGDSVFCYLTSVSPIVDRIRADKLSSGLNETLKDICTMTGSTIVESLIQTAAKFMVSSQRRYYIQDLTFLRRNFRHRLKHVLHHPWMASPKGQLPGKIAHVGVITEMLNGLDGFARDEAAVDVAPLMSQPVVELCLAIPTWMWCQGGVDRALARQAFRDALPAEVVARTWKGGPDGLAGTLFEKNRERLSLLFRDSLLARNGIVDEKAILARLEDSMPVRGGENLRLLELADAECWARHWLDRRSRFSSLDVDAVLGL